MNMIKKLMPQHGGSEGIWEGVYIYCDPEGNELDRHKSRLTHIFPDDKPDEYHQRNQYEWDDGRTEDLTFVFQRDEDEMKWGNDRSYGKVWEEKKRVGDMANVRVSWHRTKIEGYSPFDLPYATIHELIEMDADFQHRARVWQWYVDGELKGRTIIKENRVG